MPLLFYVLFLNPKFTAGDKARMLPEALNLELESLSVLQRKFLLELLHRHPHYWSKFASHERSWQGSKEALEEFLQNHQAELFRKFAEKSLHGNAW
ncbi:MAG: hypothetical protein QXQ47_02690 [Candidatus Bathyarchaeia archaeon]